LIHGSTHELDHRSVAENGCDLLADYLLIIGMVAVPLEIRLSGEDSDDSEVVTRRRAADIAAAHVAFDTVEVGDEGAERVSGARQRRSRTGGGTST
jgi:hypothetical protein